MDSADTSSTKLCHLRQEYIKARI